MWHGGRFLGSVKLVVAYGTTVSGHNMCMKREISGDANDSFKQLTGTNFEKFNDIPIKATGAGVPEPVMSFTSPNLLVGFTCYTTPPPVQKHSIPIIANRRDLMAWAQPGSGKAGRSLFPILFASFDVRPCTAPVDFGYGDHCCAMPTALILAPTCELVSQTHKEAHKFSYRSWVHPAVVYGSADISQQI
ncbi:hypothetical protein GYMLUDRAFT_1023761 [Collybiopsis luxurians FD-317 M1]|nr:hypothetical protein GYMLUDRAFT_1023761 [Collybiopsis luxurians FD-317 M1]